MNGSTSVQRRGPRPGVHRLLLVAVVVCASIAFVGPVLAPAPVAASPVGTVSMLGVGMGIPGGIALGPDGNLWFTNVKQTVGRITPSGTITNFAGAGLLDTSNPGGIVAGPDGSLWFANNALSIGRITTSGTISIFFGAGINGPQGIALGPDGNLWFANTGNDSIGRITTTGVVSNFTSGLLNDPQGIVAGSDGNLWFTNGLTVGRITRACTRVCVSRGSTTTSA